MFAPYSIESYLLTPNMCQGVEKNKPNSNDELQVERIARFWADCRKALADDGMDPHYFDWYLKRAQQFVEKTRNVRLKEKTAEDIRAYLAGVAVRWGSTRRSWTRSVCFSN